MNQTQRGVAGFMTQQFRSRKIVVCVLSGLILTGISQAQDSAQEQSDNNVVFAALLHSREYRPSRAQSQPQGILDQQARTRAMLADVLNTGTPVHISLVKPVDARKNKPSAELIATTAEEIKSADGA